MRTGSLGKQGHMELRRNTEERRGPGGISDSGIHGEWNWGHLRFRIVSEVMVGEVALGPVRDGNDEDCLRFLEATWRRSSLRKGRSSAVRNVREALTMIARVLKGHMGIAFAEKGLVFRRQCVLNRKRR